MLDRIYYRIIRKLITRKDEQAHYSGGLWPGLVRDRAAEVLDGFKGSIVDLGCGEGLFLKKLAERNPDAAVCGVDFNPDILDAARQRLEGYGNIELVPINALSTGLAQNSFDACFCLNTLINLDTMDDVRGLMAEAGRLLKPGGRFIFDVRNAANPLIRLQYRFARYYDTGIQVPLRSYPAAVIERTATEKGFHLIEKRPLGFPANRFAPVILYITEKP